MALYNYIWTDEIVEHVAEHGVTPEDFEYVVNNPDFVGASRSSGLPAVWGYTEDGRFIMAIYDQLDESTLIPVTAYEVPEPT